MRNCSSVEARRNRATTCVVVEIMRCRNVLLLQATRLKSADRDDLLPDRVIEPVSPRSDTLGNSISVEVLAQRGLVVSVRSMVGRR